MDNLTHSLVGFAGAKAGLQRLSPAVTGLSILAANAPDADIVVLLFGDRWTFLQHHRGITHAIVGTICLALVLPLVFYGVDLAWARLRGQPPRTNFRGLLIASAVVSATHPLLDWTNNYGIRLFLPWSPEWFYGDLVFIVDPFLWLVLGGTCFLLASKTTFLKFVWAALAAILTFLMVVGPRRSAFANPLMVSGLWAVGLITLIVLFVNKAAERWGARIALVSFVLVGLYWIGLAFVHSKAVEKAHEEAARMTKQGGETISRLAAMPTLANPLAWDCVFETDQATYRFALSLAGEKRIGTVVRYAKPSPELVEPMRTISQDRRAQVFLGFARFPVMRLVDPDCATQTLVQLADLRYTEPGRSRGSFSLEVPVDCTKQPLVGSR